MDKPHRTFTNLDAHFLETLRGCKPCAKRNNPINYTFKTDSKAFTKSKKWFKDDKPRKPTKPQRQ